MENKRKKFVMDGNEAAAHIAYAFTEIAAIYPITPSTTMAEYTDIWSARGRKNIFGTIPKVIEMQSEAGAAGVVHGSLQSGALTTTFTASQGLLLKIPNMYKISGELLPGVIHVAARTLSTHALSIFGDHQDIYAVRMTGWALLASSSVQEVMELAGVAHLSAIKSRVPFLHFFDGFRTSHEIQKIEVLEYDELERLIDYDALNEFRKNSLNPDNPVTRGTAQNDDIYFQAREAQNKYYEKSIDIVKDYMKEISLLTGREYKPYTYYGHPEARNIIIAMGSVCETIKETVDFLNKRGQKVGMIKVSLYRPFSAKDFINEIPETVKKIAVLDRTKEPGSYGEPLYLDVKSVLYSRNSDISIVGGRYGLSSKDVNPSQIIAVFNNLVLKQPKDHFTIGIVDDVTFTSLPIYENPDLSNSDDMSCLFYGLGSDGTVSANKSSVKIIGDLTDKYVQAYFAYDSKKAGGITRSHLRFSNYPIRSTYLVKNPTFVSCSNQTFLKKYPVIEGLKQNGIFLLNSIYEGEKLLDSIPNKIKRELAFANAKFFVINANRAAIEAGMISKTNTIMQAAFFKVINIVEYEDAKREMKSHVLKNYGLKGEDVVEKNNKLIDIAENAIVEIPVDPKWKTLVDEDEYLTLDYGNSLDRSSFMAKIAEPITALRGDELPVSIFDGFEDGTFENGEAQYEKRAIAKFIPEWRPEHCIQCNQCSYVCPHAAIRPFLLDEKELENIPKGMDLLNPIGKGLERLRYRIQVSPLDCTGCNACAEVCPARTKALVMRPIEEQLEKGEKENADYLYNHVSYKDEYMNKETVKGSQFVKPLFEFSGACAGCGETPYIKLLTQLYGDRMMIANSTGCSSIYGGYAPSTPYTTNDKGQGPAWASSLFEDSAEYGYGMLQASEKLRFRVIELLTQLNEKEINDELKTLVNDYLENVNDANHIQSMKENLFIKLEEEKEKIDEIKELLELKSYFIERAVWVIGGDGWAYDIGFGGLDHVLGTGDKIKMLVLDTEVYSNTGGQSSSASTIASVAKFTSNGKRKKKKDLAALMMSYGDIYVAKISMGANQNQTIKALKEAQEFDGPAIVIAYSPCIAHGIKGGMGAAQDQEKLATEVGYWPLLRYDPRRLEKGKNPLQIDSRKPVWDKYFDYLMSETRFSSLFKTSPEHANELFELNLKNAKERWNYYYKLSKIDYSEEV
ncbi:pyruvate:ferredoxin (flavodoxin) oxidoreductase [Pseudostreptobacillus hongkongensis]|uniref:pyruvate:ferredoxin (flavodoxin) oxidoreductase n=1 Tax=Pseudostreptobacillus hongkongensis TaxID=1162717 RepID=UPI000835CAFB|nr:pyruvate:ferredoxin (flavodoxin) oxidoreductase [Pseudostreptobacillus hongkongensis]